jgi:hypothetical protein
MKILDCKSKEEANNCVHNAHSQDWVSHHVPFQFAVFTFQITVPCTRVVLFQLLWSKLDATFCSQVHAFHEISTRKINPFVLRITKRTQKYLHKHPVCLILLFVRSAHSLYVSNTCACYSTSSHIKYWDTNNQTNNIIYNRCVFTNRYSAGSSGNFYHNSKVFLFYAMVSTTKWVWCRW